MITKIYMILSQGSLDHQQVSLPASDGEDDAACLVCERRERVDAEDIRFHEGW